MAEIEAEKGRREGRRERTERRTERRKEKGREGEMRESEEVELLLEYKDHRSVVYDLYHNTPHRGRATGTRATGTGHTGTGRVRKATPTKVVWPITYTNMSNIT